MLPIRDENPSGIRPVVSYTIIAINVIAFLLELIFGDRIIYQYGFIPRLFLEDPVGNSYRLITSMFLHGGFLHIGGNMLYLFIFGDNVEATFGKIRYLFFYLACGLGALALHLFFNPYSTTPVIGASGAISGVLAAYMLFYPDAKIDTIVFAFWVWFFTKIRAFYFIGFWFLYQLLIAPIGSVIGIAVWAHIGGFITGLILAAPLRKKARRRRFGPVLPQYWYEYY